MLTAVSLLQPKIALSIEAFHACMNQHPLAQIPIPARMDTYAAHALDVIERQTGLGADINDMLNALTHHAGGRMRYGRIRTDHEHLIVFRDLSFLSYRENEEGSEDYNALVPCVFALDAKWASARDGKLSVKCQWDGLTQDNESLKMVCACDGEERHYAMPLSIHELPIDMRQMLSDAEKAIKNARTYLPNLPVMARPNDLGSQATSTLTDRDCGIWVNPLGSFYWPPFLSQPAAQSDDISKACAILKDLGDLALWACPVLPGVISIDILSPKVPGGRPTLSFSPQSESVLRCGDYRRAESVLKALNATFVKTIKSALIEIPAGHRTGVISSTKACATGHKICSVEVCRPNAARAGMIDREYDHDFASIRGYRNPDDQACIWVNGQEVVNPMSSLYANNQGVPYSLSQEAKTAFEQHDLPSVVSAMAGGERSYELQALCEDFHSGICAHGYRSEPVCQDTTFSYTIVAGMDHDKHLRRPFGFITVDGALETHGSQIYGIIEGRRVISYTLDLCLKCMITDRHRPVGDLDVCLFASVFQSVSALMSRMAMTAERKGHYYEVDITVDRMLGYCINDDLMDDFTCAIQMLRSALANANPSGHISIGHIIEKWNDYALS